MAASRLGDEADRLKREIEAQEERPRPPALRFPKPIHAEPSAAYIMDTLQAFTSAWEDMLRTGNVSDLATEISARSDEEREDLQRRIAMIRPEYKQRILTLAQDVRPVNMWRKYRETYEPHPAMSQALVKMKSDSAVPGEVFGRLRHPNPTFLLPGAPPITHADGNPGRILAIFVSGAVSRRLQRDGDPMRLGDAGPGNASVLLDTHDPAANSFHAMVVSEVHNPEGTQVIDMDWCHLTVPVREAFTLDDLVFAIASDGFNWEATMGELAGDTRFQYLTDVSRATVSHLLYACSRTAEIDDKPRASRPPVKRKKGEPKPLPSARIRRMGWVTGAAITDSVRRPAAHTDAPGTGKSRRPHMRGAHLHLYRVGPGRQEIELKWLDPIPVNAGKDDGTTITNHPMR